MKQLWAGVNALHAMVMLKQRQPPERSWGGATVTSRTPGKYTKESLASSHTQAAIGKRPAKVASEGQRDTGSGDHCGRLLSNTSSAHPTPGSKQ